MEMDAITLLEKDLQSVFAPVKPNPEFVERLERRLTREDRVALEQESSRTGWIIAVAGAAVGLLVIGLIRLLVRGKSAR